MTKYEEVKNIHLNVKYLKKREKLSWKEFDQLVGVRDKYNYWVLSIGSACMPCQEAIDKLCEYFSIESSEDLKMNEEDFRSKYPKEET